MAEDERQFTGVWISHAIIGTAASFAVGLRFLVRSKTKNSVKWDDWTALISMILMWIDFACAIHVSRLKNKGPPAGEPIKQFESRMMVVSFASMFPTLTCETMTRLSLVLLYYRLFSIKLWLRRSLQIVTILSIMWLATMLTIITFQCKPIAKAIKPFIPGRCINLMLAFVIAEAINLVLDLVMVILPISTILKLRLPLRDRLGICFIFLTSSVVIITQILRMAFGYDRRGGGVLSLEQSSIWTGLHLGFAIICTCLPIFRVYLPKDDGAINKKLKRFYATLATRFSRSSNKSSDCEHTKSTFPSFVRSSRQGGVQTPATDELSLAPWSRLPELEEANITLQCR